MIISNPRSGERAHARPTAKVAAKVVVLMTLALSVFLGPCATQQQTLPEERELATGGRNGMIISTPAFENGERIPEKYTCDGPNINPSLIFEGVPEEGKNLALIVDDPDAPAGTWVHWTVWNIEPRSGGVDEDSLPPGAVEGMTSFGEPGYGGPCPPSGTHRYFFKLYALDAELDLATGASSSDLEAALEEHVLETAELVGLYSR